MAVSKPLPRWQIIAALALVGASTITPGMAGDFSNPVPIDTGSNLRNRAMNSEITRFSLGMAGSGGGSGMAVLGDYYERYQSAQNWSNVVQINNTIVLNGNDNTVSVDNGTLTANQDASNICQNSNLSLQSGEASSDAGSSSCAGN